jgi:uncharacterized cupredoxin-like copper-binding protein
MRRTLLVVAAAFVAFALTIGVSLARRSSGPAGDTVVKTTNFHIVMPVKLRAGPHTFAYTNEGSVAHEVLLFRTDQPGNALPLRADGDVDEESPLLHSVVDSGSPTAPGASESVPTKAPLTPGHYVAVCNLPGHYRLGMWLNVTVT